MTSRATILALFGFAMLAGTLSPTNAKTELPPGFVDAAKAVPSLVLDVRYATDDNFVGKPIDGYLASRCIMTDAAAAALKLVQIELAEHGLGLKVFDAYRPQRAVDHFVRWSQDASDQRTKDEYYPNIDKRDLISAGYIASRSSHSRGAAVDLTIVAFTPDGTAEELDMGTPFDFFGPESWIDSTEATPQQRANRLLLRTVMIKHGFRPYDKEWWHFSLVDEPFPGTYFDFPVE